MSDPGRCTHQHTLCLTHSHNPDNNACLISGEAPEAAAPEEPKPPTPPPPPPKGNPPFKSEPRSDCGRTTCVFFPPCERPASDRNDHCFISTQRPVCSAFLTEPTSAPLDLFVEDKNDTSVSIIWSQPEVVGSSGLDGYTIEICKDGSKSSFLRW